MSRLGRTIAVLLPFLVLSCTKTEQVAGPAGSQGAQGATGDSVVLTGNIQGKILLYDTLGNALSADSNATLSLENTSPLIEFSSALDGTFTLSNVHAGVYTIDAAKTGFGTMRFFDFTHSGTSQPSQTGLLKIGQQLSSNFDIRQLTIDTINTGSSYYLNITITLAHPQQIDNPVLLYFSDVSGSGNSNNLHVYRLNYFQQNSTTLLYSPFNDNVSAWSDRLHAATWLYITAAIDNPGLFTYTDENGNAVYPSAGQLSNEVKVYNVLK